MKNSDIYKWKQIVENLNGRIDESDEDVNHTDHEVSMAKSQLLSSMKSAVRIAGHLKDKSESEGLEGWVASKLTVAEDYLQAVADYMDGEELQEGYKILPPMDKEKYQPRNGLEGPFSTLSGKVVYYDPKAGKYYDPDTDMYMSYDEFRRYDDDYKGMKDERDEVKEDTVKYEDHYDDRVVLTIEKDKLLYNGNPIQNYNWDSAAKHIISDKFYGRAKSWEEVHQYLVRFLDNPKGLQAAVRQVFNTNDEGVQVNETIMVSEAQFDEAAGEKDACYRKVKSRYKVWPSAYASGALVKCRKVGAKNWGNSKK